MHFNLFKVGSYVIVFIDHFCRLRLYFSCSYVSIFSSCNWHDDEMDTTVISGIRSTACRAPTSCHSVCFTLQLFKHVNYTGLKYTDEPELVMQLLAQNSFGNSSSHCLTRWPSLRGMLTVLLKNRICNGSAFDCGLKGMWFEPDHCHLFDRGSLHRQ